MLTPTVVGLFLFAVYCRIMSEQTEYTEAVRTIAEGFARLARMAVPERPSLVVNLGVGASATPTFPAPTPVMPEVCGPLGVDIPTSTPSYIATQRRYHALMEEAEEVRRVLIQAGGMARTVPQGTGPLAFSGGALPGSECWSGVPSVVGSPDRTPYHPYPGESKPAAGGQLPNRFVVLSASEEFRTGRPLEHVEATDPLVGVPSLDETSGLVPEIPEGGAIPDSELVILPGDFADCTAQIELSSDLGGWARENPNEVASGPTYLPGRYLETLDDAWAAAIPSEDRCVPTHSPLGVREYGGMGRRPLGNRLIPRRLLEPTHPEVLNYSSPDESSEDDMDEIRVAYAREPSRSVGIGRGLVCGRGIARLLPGGDLDEIDLTVPFPVGRLSRSQRDPPSKRSRCDGCGARTKRLKTHVQKVHLVGRLRWFLAPLGCCMHEGCLTYDPEHARTHVPFLFQRDAPLLVRRLEAFFNAILSALGCQTDTALFSLVRDRGLSGPVAAWTPREEHLYARLDAFLGLPRLAVRDLSTPERMTSLMHWRTLQRLLTLASGEGSLNV